MGTRSSVSVDAPNVMTRLRSFTLVLERAGLVGHVPLEPSKRENSASHAWLDVPSASLSRTTTFVYEHHIVTQIYQLIFKTQE